MKKMLCLSVIMSCFFIFSKAQQPVRKDRIEKYLTREDGVQKVTVDYKRKTCKVTYLWDRTTIENIKTAIANIGYDAGDVTADPEAYKRLPTCCKKPEDGGGHEKK
jgi:periplasmic mercuric ion binding protein